MFPANNMDWWKTTFHDVKCAMGSPAFVSAIRAIGAISATIFVITNTPRWMKLAMDQHHFLGINVVILVGIFIYRIWKKYCTDVNISVFRLVKTVIYYIKLFSENYVALDPASQNYDELYERRKINRTFIRTGIIFVLMQYCIVPRGHLLWVQCMVAFRFLKEVSLTVYENKEYIFRRRDEEDEATNDESSRREDNNNEEPSIKHEILINAGKTLLIVLVFYKVLMTSFTYFALTSLCFCLINRILEQPLTKALEYYQFDFFEGLEQFYVTGILGFTEVGISFVFMTWTLLLHNQYLMLIALYTNVYMTCKEVIHGAIIAALTEWMVLVQFNRATKEELNELDDVCSVCLSTMKKARKTKCNHFFHGHCLRRCLKEKNSCPYCNQKLVL